MAKNQRPIFTEDNFDKTCRPVIFHDGAVTKEWASLFGSYKAYYADISNNKEVLLFFESKGAVEGFQVGKDVCDSFVSHFGPKVLAFLQDYGMPDVFDSSSRFNIGDGLEENLDNVEIKSRYPIVGYSNQASIFFAKATSKS
ncbi:hypothetical protein [Asticcacaulis biprosthecium]|uniref:hypothetical protein n=1 Tax=Asticcacaulis biprosthecium TaxID=76891 RepID=UPI00058BDC34|nr:hypothetical protein [Asticcacaulis biprosthecium]